jgi:hypothetical protein
MTLRIPLMWERRVCLSASRGSDNSAAVSYPVKATYNGDTATHPLPPPMKSSSPSRSEYQGEGTLKVPTGYRSEPHPSQLFRLSCLLIIDLILIDGPR